jgi:hypothetical protein
MKSALRQSPYILLNSGRYLTRPWIEVGFGRDPLLAERKRLAPVSAAFSFRRDFIKQHCKAAFGGLYLVLTADSLLVTRRPAPPAQNTCPRGLFFCPGCCNRRLRSSVVPAAAVSAAAGQHGTLAPSLLATGLFLSGLFLARIQNPSSGRADRAHLSAR